MSNYLEEYQRSSEPDKREKGYLWQTAIGLQAVDGLETSKYLNEIAKKNIEGIISVEKAVNLIDDYYKLNAAHTPHTEEADKVSSRIAALLSEEKFVFSPAQYISIHKRLFDGIYKFAGQIRDYNITKNEWVLDGDTVMYGGVFELRAALDYDFECERNFKYDNLPADEVISHLAKFVSNLWQIHIFGEGNTRTTAVFLIKYLKSLGYDVTNDTFAKNALYFRNSLVRANYNNHNKSIYETTEYLELFLRNFILGESNRLLNQSIHISEKTEEAFAREEERVSKKKALELFDRGILNKLIAGEFSSLKEIHNYLFDEIYDFAGVVRTVNLAKGNFRFAPVMYLESALENIDKMPQSTFDEIVEKYVEMNIAHPFREGNGRSARIWLDLILKKELHKVVDWSKVDKEDYLLAMERSPIKDIEIKYILKNALTDKIDSREVYMKGIDQSYYYEGYTTFKTEEL